MKPGNVFFVQWMMTPQLGYFSGFIQREPQLIPCQNGHLAIGAQADIITCGGFAADDHHLPFRRYGGQAMNYRPMKVGSVGSGLVVVENQVAYRSQFAEQPLKEHSREERQAGLILCFKQRQLRLSVGL